MVVDSYIRRNTTSCAFRCAFQTATTEKAALTKHASVRQPHEIDRYLHPGLRGLVRPQSIHVPKRFEARKADLHVRDGCIGLSALRTMNGRGKQVQYIMSALK